MAIPTYLAYEGRGHAGPPFILVHGFPLDRSMWRRQLEDLSTAARMVAIDLPGFGATAATLDGDHALTMDAMAEHVINVANGLGFDRFILGGLSMGGYVAFALLRKHRARVLALALFDTRAEPDSKEGRAGRHATANRVILEGTAPLVQGLPGLLSPRTLAERADLVNHTELMIRRVSPAGAASALRGMAERKDARAELARIDVPTLVAVGADDKITPPENMKLMAQAIPRAEFAVIANAGHLSPFEQPDAANVALRKLIRKAKLS